MVATLVRCPMFGPSVNWELTKNELEAWCVKAWMAQKMEATACNFSLRRSCWTNVPDYLNACTVSGVCIRT